MPYRSEKIKLSETQDRRRKLTEEQKAEITRLYLEGRGSWKALADRYHVSKKTIGLIVNPEMKKRCSQRIKEHWRDYRPDRESWAATMREHRRYKQGLYLRGELSEESAKEEPTP